MQPKLPFGLKNGQIIEISKVNSGLLCGCICPSCSGKLIARKGKKTIHHFAHYKSIECRGAFETALHLAAKFILDRSRKFRLPAVMTSLGNEEGNEICLFKSQMLNFDEVYLEKRLDKIIPDLLVITSERSLIIEITYSHPIDYLKKRRIQLMNISAIEVELINFEGPMTLEKLEKTIIYSIKNKKWIYNVKREFFLDKVRSYGIKLKLYNRKIYKCPLRIESNEGNTVCDLLNDCFSCSYFIHANGDFSASQKYIICAGHAMNEICRMIEMYQKPKYYTPIQ
jgi:hypothetical protein